MKARFLIVTLCCVNTVMADTISGGSLIPGATDGLYYKIGGGQVTPLPLAKDNTTIHLNVGGNAGLGYNCGVFNPEASIVNSLNDVEGSFGNITTQIYESATGMLMSLPAYLLAKTMPEVYKLMQDGMTNGQFDFNTASKSCQAMMRDIDRGNNPYNDWMQASMGDAWKYNMSLADSSLVKQGLLGAESTTDINQANIEINQNNGKDGVAWVQGVSQKGDIYAGGQGQPVIQLVRDTVVAGYNVLIGEGRTYDDTSTPLSDDGRLVSTFGAPEIAADWVTTVVGEQHIATYAGGDKQSVPGVGLLGDVQSETDIIKEKLSKLVEGSMPLSIENLAAVSPPKININAEVIQMLRKQDNDLIRAIYVSKISEEIASAKVLDKAKLGLQCLEVGAQVPAIMSNTAAQNGLIKFKERLRAFMQDLRDNPEDNERFVGNTLVTLMQSTRMHEASSLAMRPGAVTPPAMKDGAVMVGG